MTARAGLFIRKFFVGSVLWALPTPGRGVTPLHPTQKSWTYSECDGKEEVILRFALCKQRPRKLLLACGVVCFCDRIKRQT